MKYVAGDGLLIEEQLKTMPSFTHTVLSAEQEINDVFIGLWPKNDELIR